MLTKTMVIGKAGGSSYTKECEKQLRGSVYNSECGVIPSIDVFADIT